MMNSRFAGRFPTLVLRALALWPRCLTGYLPHLGLTNVKTLFFDAISQL